MTTIDEMLPHGDQARFVRDHYGYPDDRVRFEVCDLLDFAQRYFSAAK